MHDFFLLFDGFRLTRDFLQQNLHHINLAETQTVHLVLQLLSLARDLRRLEV